jgi:DNA-directed RNA polymerase specialized sigma24 family protein
LPDKTKTDDYNNHELLALIAEGDEQAFTQLYKSTVNNLRLYLGKILKDKEALLEVLQETYIKVWLNRDKLTEVIYLPAYIAKIAAHEAFTYLNKNAHIILYEPSFHGGTEQQGFNSQPATFETPLALHNRQSG